MPPVRDVGVVERRLEELVLEHEPLLLRELVVDRAEALGEAVLAAAHVALARVVGALGQPDLQVARPGLVHHLDALEVVVDRLLPDAPVGVGQGAELVVVVLEGVGVDGAERDALLLGVRRQGGVVVHPVPRDVERHGGGEAGEAVDGGGVGDLLLDRARRTGRSEDLEAGAGVAVGQDGTSMARSPSRSRMAEKLEVMTGPGLVPWEREGLREVRGRARRAGPRGGRPRPAARSPGRAGGRAPRRTRPSRPASGR